MWSALSSDQIDLQGVLQENPHPLPPPVPPTNTSEEQLLSNEEKSDPDEASSLKANKELSEDAEKSICRTIEEEQDALKIALEEDAKAIEEGLKEIEGYKEILEQSARKVANAEQKALEIEAEENSDDFEKELDELEKEFKERFAKVEGMMGELGSTLQKDKENLERFGRELDNAIAELEREYERQHKEGEDSDFGSSEHASKSRDRQLKECGGNDF